MSQLPTSSQSAVAASSDVESLVRKGKDELQRQFESFLAGEQGMDPAERQEMARLFSESMSGVSGPADDSGAPFDRNAWRNTVESLQQASGMSDDEAAQLIRSLNDALDAFESRDSKLVIEFTRRIQTDGEQSALEWYRAQKEAKPANFPLRSV
ncbi:ANP1/MMN9/VAN1 family protein [Luteimonas sp. BDR2-5]|uniref:ANP1/MMN9/VAN1 family protein n=1 Tax=Proluteimonas luteida TaxID=2878685 RepID=UPI001E57920E|nr:ANP1/MMN9/VAN1 family protein [Luteimonas sp. BDR2-5]MCD9029468.1 ANP1/MMN9/VAN1 family protein [Luteimonas sp. BDR2-5]